MPPQDDADPVPMVETARIRALVALCYPDHMTPIAKRQFDHVCEEVERAAREVE